MMKQTDGDNRRIEKVKIEAGTEEILRHGSRDGGRKDDRNNNKQVKVITLSVDMIGD